jgi:hypothetical protein
LSSTIAAISVATHGSFHQSLKMLHVSYYVWNPGTFHLPTTRNPDQTDQPCILWMPDIRTGRAATDLLHQWEFFQCILHLISFSSPLLLTHQFKGSKKSFYQSSDHHRIAAKREQQDWHSQELWLHWHVNSDKVDVKLPSVMCDPTKNYCHNLFLWPV